MLDILDRRMQQIEPAIPDAYDDILDILLKHHRSWTMKMDSSCGVGWEWDRNKTTIIIAMRIGYPCGGRCCSNLRNK